MRNHKQEPIASSKEKEFEKFFTVYDKKKKSEKTEFCLDFIISKLKKSSISAMVGAGFSLNANLDKNTNEIRYKDWAGILVNAFKDLYPDSDLLNEKDSNKQYDKIKRNIKRCGESEFSAEYVKKHGSRQSLDFYIENEFSKINKDNDKLDLHRELLSLDWCDVLTTNWDDLLERASNEANSNILFKKVTSAKELRVANKARIIKLNGSLRTDKQKKSKIYRFDDTDDYLYVITPDDFADYHFKHEGFSTFMKVKILENSLCLFGFSGHDPNFQYWIKELKSTMQKGGKTEDPNPIFLITPLDEQKKYSNKLEKKIAEIDKKAEKQFFMNNYIIPLKIDEINKYLEKNYEGYNPIPGETEKSEEIFLMFDNFFRYLYSKTKEVTVQDYNYNKDNTKILRQIAFSNANNLTDGEIITYNAIPLFNFQNLNYTSDFIYKIQSLGEKVPEWTKDTFVFIYRWCVSNYYSLQNLYEASKIEEIINHYLKNILPKNEAPEFMELVLKYYSDFNDKKFDVLIKKYKDFELLRDCIYYAQAYHYYIGFYYKELKDLLNTWTPTKDRQNYSLYMLRKISLMVEYENARFLKDDIKAKIDKMYKMALSECTDNQLKYFILLSYRQTAFGNENYNPDEITRQIEEIESQTVNPRRYLEVFLNAQDDALIKPNEDARYSVNVQVFRVNNAGNPLISTTRLLNFLDYTGISCLGLLHKKELIELGKNVKSYDYYLVRVLIKSLQYFGNSSGEEFLRAIVPKIIRYLNEYLISELLKQVYEIFDYKISNNQNATIYIYLLTELAKRSNEEARKYFIEHFFFILKKEINKKSDYSLVLSPIVSGNVWGWNIPFNYFLGEVSTYITDENEIAVIIKWLIENYIIDENTNTSPYFISENRKYFINFIHNTKNAKMIKKIFAIKVIEDLFMDNNEYINIIALDVFEYLSKERQSQLVEYFEQNYTLKINPHFIYVLRSSDLNKRVIKLLDEYEMLAENPLLYRFDYYIRALCHSKILGYAEIDELIKIISNKFKKLTNNKDYFKYTKYRYSQKVNELFESLCELQAIANKNNDIDDELYNTMKTEFIRENKELFSFTWLYDENLQNFKKQFMNMITVLSYLEEEQKYTNIINIALSKIVVQDSSEFEAVIEQFLNCYEANYGNNVLNNEMTKQIMIEIYNKFTTNIPDCYDDLFIKEQLKRLEKILNINIIKENA